jgi:hypothetical protein
VVAWGVRWVWFRYNQAAERIQHPNPTVDTSSKAPQLTFANLVGAGDIDGPYLIANVGDSLTISDFNCIANVKPPPPPS